MNLARVGEMPSDVDRLMRHNWRMEVKRLAKGAVRKRLRPTRPPVALGAEPLKTLRSRAGRPLRVAVARADGLGDLVLTIPLLATLRASPLVESVVIVGPARVRPLMAQPGYEFELFDLPTISTPGYGVRVGVQRLFATSRVIQSRAVRAGAAHVGKYDLVVLPRFEADAGVNLRAWALGTGAPIAGHDPANLRFVTRSEGREGSLLDVCTGSADRTVHEMTHLAELLRTLGLPSAIPENAGQEFFGVSRSVIDPHVVVHASAARGHREWPTDRWRQLIEALRIREPDLTFSLVGGPEDGPRHADIVSGMSGKVRSLIGSVNLRDLPALMARSRAFIGSDSGPAHIAASVGLPVVVVSPHPVLGDPSHSNSPTRYRPWSQVAKVVQPQVALPPCTLSCEASRPHCITQVTVDEVVAAYATVVAKCT